MRMRVDEAWKERIATEIERRPPGPSALDTYDGAVLHDDRHVLQDASTAVEELRGAYGDRRRSLASQCRRQSDDAEQRVTDVTHRVCAMVDGVGQSSSTPKLPLRDVVGE